MREKRSVSTLAVHAVAPSPLCLAHTHAAPLKVNNLCAANMRACADLPALQRCFLTAFGRCMICSVSRDGDFAYHASSMWLMLGVVVVVSGVCGCLRVFVCLSSLQARVKNEILDYKDLAALPKVKAIYEVQQPDLISSSYQPYHRYTSDDRLDTYSYGEVQLPHTPDQTWHLSRHQPVFWGGTFGFVFERIWAQKKWVLSYRLNIVGLNTVIIFCQNIDSSSF